jgi:hypothetical protein
VPQLISSEGDMDCEVYNSVNAHYCSLVSIFLKTTDLISVRKKMIYQ